MPWRILLMGLGAFLASCDATRPPCASDLDCFLGERCVDSACEVFEPDVGTSDVREDVPTTDDCRVNLTACEPQPCNTTTGECFKCEFDRQCGEEGVCNETTGECTCRAGFHRCGTQCVSDDADGSCGSRCEPCPGLLNGFGFCEDQVCDVACNPNWHLCEGDCTSAPGMCVQCLGNDDCPADNPVCQNGTCTGCRTDADCAGKTGFSVCSEGSCVVCTEDKKDACGGRTCNPETNVCTNTSIGAVGVCGLCVTDDDCETGSACAPMFFQGVKRPTAYCLFTRDLGPCYQPFPIQVSRTTVSNEELVLCAFDENLATCEAYLQYGDLCDTDEDCGAQDLNDGLCKPFLGDDRCTYLCNSSWECPNAVPPVCATYCRDAP